MLITWTCVLKIGYFTNPVKTKSNVSAKFSIDNSDII